MKQLPECHLQNAMYESFSWEELAKKIYAILHDKTVYVGPELNERECKAMALGMFIATDERIYKTEEDYEKEW